LLRSGRCAATSSGSVIDRRTYRRYYRLAKGGAFRSLADLRRHMVEAGVLKEGGK